MEESHKNICPSLNLESVKVLSLQPFRWRFLILWYWWGM